MCVIPLGSDKSSLLPVEKVSHLSRCAQIRDWVLVLEGEPPM